MACTWAGTCSSSNTWWVKVGWNGPSRTDPAAPSAMGQPLGDVAPRRRARTLAVAASAPKVRDMSELARFPATSPARAPDTRLRDPAAQRGRGCPITHLSRAAGASRPPSGKLQLLPAHNLSRMALRLAAPLRRTMTTSTTLDAVRTPRGQRGAVSGQTRAVRWLTRPRRSRRCARCWTLRAGPRSATASARSSRRSTSSRTSRLACSAAARRAGRCRFPTGRDPTPVCNVPAPPRAKQVHEPGCRRGGGCGCSADRQRRPRVHAALTALAPPPCADEPSPGVVERLQHAARHADHARRGKHGHAEGCAWASAVMSQCRPCAFDHPPSCVASRQADLANAMDSMEAELRLGSAGWN